ncbi:MAG: DUF421 domain-containing protein [Anaerolineae bacterium]
MIIFNQNFNIIEVNPISLAAVALRTFIVYLFVLGALRLFGKRELGQLTPFDLVVILLISNAVQNAMVGPDNSLTAGLVAAGVLLVTNWGISRLAAHYRPLGKLVIGEPVLLIHHGEFIQRNMDREQLTRDEVIGAMREHGIAKVEDVDMAWLEVDGAISFVPIDGDVKRTRKRIRGRKPQE